MSVNLDRRSFLAGTGAACFLLASGGLVKVSGHESLLRPPGGQDEDRFYRQCLRCDRCRSVCPHGCITISILEEGLLNARTPRLDFHKGYCDFCNKCIEVCPTSALVAASGQEQRLGVAQLSADECVCCGKCEPACIYGAIALDEAKRPIIDESICNGCGECEFICPSASYAFYDGSAQRAIHVCVTKSDDGEVRDEIQ